MDMTTPKPLPIPTPYARATPVLQEHVRAMLTGIAPGWYLTRDLYPRYVTWAENEGRTPATAKSLGETLARMGVERSGSHGNVSVWHIAESMTRG